MSGGGSGSGAEAPRVSVVMPVYNEARYLALALDSILAQTYQDFELIVIDDASTDATPDILAEYGARDPRLRVITNPENRGGAGIAGNLNLGLREARGEFIARMDADDISLPERFARQVAFLDAHPDHVLVGTNFHVIDADGRVRRTLVHGTEPWEFEWISLFHPPVSHPSAMFRAWLVREKSIFYDETYRAAEDFDIWPRMLDHGKGVLLPKPLILYRMHAANVSSRRLDQQLRESRDIALHHLMRRYPDLAPDAALLGELYGRFFHRDSSGDQSYAPLIEAMTLLEDRFLHDHRLAARQKRRLRVLAARFLVGIAKRAGTVTSPLQALRFLWHVRPYWSAMLRDTPRFIAQQWPL